VAEADHLVEDGVVRKESWRTASAPSSARSSGGQSWLTGGADAQRDGHRGGDGMVA
jgi:hypothetical protein